MSPDVELPAANERAFPFLTPVLPPFHPESEQAVGGATEFVNFLESAKKGDPLPVSSIIKFASFFKDDLTLDNMGRMQLTSMCTYMSISPYGSDSFLRFQLRYKIRQLKQDDQRILWEGIEELTKMELKEACQVSRPSCFRRAKNTLTSAPLPSLNRAAL